MSSQNVDSPPKSSQVQKSKSGVRAALEFTGIPPSWFEKRPKLPSRNWLIFLSVTTSIVSYYAYDRRECRRIRDEYASRVEHLAKDPLGTADLPRKVTVYGAKWPGDEDHDKSLRFFRKYVKPILVAAAVDYEMVSGRRSGDLADRIADEIKARRRVDAGVEPVSQSPIVLPNQPSLEQKRKRELEGGIVLVGRHTLKEFMSGLKRGWTESMGRADREDMLAQELASDGRFDEPEELVVDSDGVDGEPLPTRSRLLPSQNAALFSPLHIPSSSPPKSTQSVSNLPAQLDTPPSTIPTLPTLLLVPFTNHIGFRQVPHMLWGFFNERHKVRAGSEAAYSLIMNHVRPFAAPNTTVAASEGPSQSDGRQGGDLDFDLPAESYYNGAYSPSETEKARKTYYDALPAKLATARALARGTRAPTKEEESHPPPTEVELRAERLKKEMRWRGDEAGWEIVKPGQPAQWDERLPDALQVFDQPRADDVG
ncbi:inner membrane protein import complex subunit Tim54-domain-containing protein [Suillus clintonianus]|uniref:inner membrane protein import complex subunit Tim54-domain-containing protein n=1 Tax=Suillus clintonianus TaxID=1904413 RepID=UPI001B865BE6|nr:inner membrane protein import complex subunit Tim54-domain-containing protein [Suillus clintonianus]KAG2157505.1 inner membrane protein import complex subunit Tim54-domain-containing protein [Suillus clintonianus]